MRWFAHGRKRFADLSEREILALAISAEEDDARIYAGFAERLKGDYPETAAVFRAMEAEEDGHRRALIDEHERRFGGAIPLIRREHVADYVSRRPVWLVAQLGIERMREEADRMEDAACRFYEEAVKRVGDPSTRRLLGDLAEAERRHKGKANALEEAHLTPDARAEEDKTARKQLILTLVQPGLAGLMDGSVSTLAPIFATAFATQNSHTTLLVGLAAAVGAGISMGFTEAAHDDGVLSGRGSPVKRGLASGIMTAVGGLGHALPYLIPDFWTATAIALVVVFVELWAIVWIQHRFMETPIVRAAVQIIVGGALVLAAGILIGGG
ncbi:iron exporter MbfA [uncultured Aureimonas sp.]|uniref:iron exporter MbfA n=1 Tax=uncultured Aureimonas sp. TaxID=1604662 RepID=UPI0025EA03E5|nr:ferritin family protein [uncultured Aureimonas sp.]